MHTNNFIHYNMKETILTILLFSSLGVFSQNTTQLATDKGVDQFAEKVEMLSSENSKLKSEIEKIGRASCRERV